MDNQKTIKGFDLTKINPPQTYLLLNPVNYSVKECFKYVLMDLILKRVLIFKRIRKITPNASTIGTFRYLSPGRAFYLFKPNEYEKLFIEPFDHPNKTIQVRYLGKIIVQNHLKNIGNLQTVIMKTEPLKGNLVPVFFYWYNRNMKTTNEGSFLAYNIKTQLEEASTQIQILKKTDKAKAYEIFKSLGNNFLLLPGFNKNMFKDFEELFRDFDRNIDDSGCSTWHTNSGGCSLDSSDFGDAGCGNSSGCSSSGCSSCSSGCSGCGGGCS